MAQGKDTGMKFVIKYMSGNVRKEGNDIRDHRRIGTGYDGRKDTIVVPDHGSISLELEPGTWLNLKTSEWMHGTLSNEPEGWDMGL